MSNKIIIANWKSHKTVHEVKEWIEAFVATAPRVQDAASQMQVLIAPSFPYLSEVQSAVASLHNVAVAAQDVSQFPLGAYTGAVAAQQLASLKIQYCLVGHSERRKYFGETHQTVAQKVELLLDQGITPIVCVDEAEISEQASLIASDQRKRVIVAYEPVSAVGTGIGQDLAQVKLVVASIRTEFGPIPVLYGGSVDERNVAEYVLASDGVLVGGDSLDEHDFMQLLETLHSS